MNQLQSSRPTGAREKEPKKPNNAWNYRGQRKFGRKFTFENNKDLTVNLLKKEVKKLNANTEVVTFGQAPSIAK